MKQGGFDLFVLMLALRDTHLFFIFIVCSVNQSINLFFSSFSPLLPLLPPPFPCPLPPLSSVILTGEGVGVPPSPHVMDTKATTIESDNDEAHCHDAVLSL